MKKIHIKSFLCTLGLAGLLVSCNDDLNIVPKNQVETELALRTSADVEAAMVGAYDAISDGDLYGGNLLFLPDLLADAGDIYFQGTFQQPREVFNKRIQENNTYIANTWLDAYRAINVANSVLANLDKVEASKKSRIEGEAKFIRGTMYFELVRLYAKAWVDGNPATNPGVPLVLTPTGVVTENDKVSRNTVAEVYAQVLSDLTSAETLLPNTNGFFATKWTAAGMLSRVYLQQEKFLEAGQAADRVIQSGRYTLQPEYSEAFNRTSNVPEYVFAIQVTTQDGINDLNTFYSENQRNDIYIERQLFNLYEAADERKLLNRATFAVEATYTTKFDNQYGLIPILRLAEMYLTRAEANFRLTGSGVAGIGGVTPEADVNVVRNRAGLASVSTVALADILRERKLELMFEGQLLHDIKRTRRSVGTTPYNAESLVYPIPQRELDANSNLVQNPGY